MLILDMKKIKGYVEGILGLDNYIKERIFLKSEYIILKE